MIFYGETPPSMIDHIDGNPSNNSISNLRPANDVENQRNRAGVRGFYVEKRSYGDVYRAYIHVLGRQITLGCFPSADLAKSARIEAEKKYFGEFAADRESVCQ